MQRIDGRLVYSATDLVGYLECRHLAGLERAAASGHIDRPVQADPVLDRIAQRGTEHEARFLASLEDAGVSVARIEADRALPHAERLARGRDATIEAMRAGAEAIYQAVLFDGRRLGYADFLRRVERPSDLVDWSYEAWDTKLARSPKASAVLQLCMYSEMVGEIQGVAPERMHLALGGSQRRRVSLRVADYAAYCRLVMRGFEAMLDSAPVFPVPTEPEPVEHCETCRWSESCRARWRAADDLSLVASITSRQRRALRGAGIATRGGLAEPAGPLPDRLDGAGREALARIRAQAAIQVRGERAGAVISERIAPPRDRDGNLVPGHGLLTLPEPSPGDLFLDIEGDPFFESDEIDGIEYLFGVMEPGRRDERGRPAFHALWSIERGTVTAGGERRAFESLIDLITDRLGADPDLHVYHYAPYEPAAIRRLAGRHGTREEEVDRLLRAGSFVDLYRAVRQGVRGLLDAESTYTDAEGVARRLGQDDLIFITPYNAQVRALGRVLPGHRIGTVDKFQGQEAPVSIYSMATSSPEKAPHGMEVPLQPEPPERGHEQGAVPGRRFGQPRTAQGAAPNPATDAAGERVRTAGGTGHGEGVAGLRTAASAAGGMLGGDSPLRDGYRVLTAAAARGNFHTPPLSLRRQGRDRPHGRSLSL